MHVRDLEQKIGRENLPPVLLFCPGTTGRQKEATYEPVLAERIIQRMVDTFLDPSLHDFAFSSFYADEAKVGEIVQEAKTVPFLAERRIVVIRNTERYGQMSGDKRSPLYPLLEYIAAPMESTLLLMTAPSVDKRKKFYTTCKEAGAVVECPLLDARELTSWVEREFAARGKRAAGRAIEHLLGRTGSHLGDVNNAIALLSAYVGARADISEADVVAACADVAEESIWNLTDSIAASRPEQALRSLRQLLDYGKSHDEVIGTVNWLLESAYKASPQTGAPPPHQFVANKVTPLLKKLGLPKLKEALALCTRTQFMLRNTGVDKDLALELLVIKLSYPAAKPRAG